MKVEIETSRHRGDNMRRPPKGIQFSKPYIGRYSIEKPDRGLSLPLYMYGVILSGSALMSYCLSQVIKWMKGIM